MYLIVESSLSFLLCNEIDKFITNMKSRLHHSILSTFYFSVDYAAENWFIPKYITLNFNFPRSRQTKMSIINPYFLTNSVTQMIQNLNKNIKDTLLAFGKYFKTFN